MELKEQLKMNVGISDIQSVIQDPKVIKIYGNGFTAGFSLSDAAIVVQMSATPVALLSVSHTALKSLYVTIGETIAKIEENMGEPIKSLQDLKNEQ